MCRQIRIAFFLVFQVFALSVTALADYVYDPMEFNNEPGLYEVLEREDAGFRILIYGNSITKSAPGVEYGWMNDCGMAASSREKDFAHLVIAAMESYLNTNANYAIRNLADLERYYNTTYDIATELKGDIAHGADYIVIALGENVDPAQSGKGFEDALVNLANAFRTNGRNPRIVFRGSFWGGATVADSRNAAARVGAAFVDASPYGNSTYEAVGMTTHPGINLHPNDLGMQAIANLIIPKLQEDKEKTPEERPRETAEVVRLGDYSATTGTGVPATTAPAAGGNVRVIDGTNYVHSFIAGGTLYNNSLKTLTVDYLLVGGGGAGGNLNGGGGGGGGVVYGSFVLPVGATATVTIGAGGQASAVNVGSGGNGGNTTVAIGGETFIAHGGGGGAGHTALGGSGATGGGSSHGGGDAFDHNLFASSAYPQEGAAGGRICETTDFGGGSGGGGAGGPGGALLSEFDAANSWGVCVGGYGGAGIVSAITGEDVYYGGGGAGSGMVPQGKVNVAGDIGGRGGLGGLGGGGAGVDWVRSGSNWLAVDVGTRAGANGLGGGGSGAEYCYGVTGYGKGYAGGSGVAIFRYHVDDGEGGGGAVDGRTVPGAIIPAKERVKSSEKPGPNTINDLKDAMLVWLDQRTYPIRVDGGDGEWTIKNGSGTTFSKYRECNTDPSLGIYVSSPVDKNYPYLYYCASGGVKAPDGTLTLEPEEFAFHPDNNDTSGKLVIEFVPNRSGWYRLEGSVRATSDAWKNQPQGDGVRVQASANGANILTVGTTSDNAAHSLESEWVELGAGMVLTVTMDRVAFYGWDATGFKLRVVRDGSRVVKSHYRWSLSQAVNEYVANHQEDYAAKLLVGGLYVEMGYRSGVEAEHVTFADRFRDSDALVGWKRSGTGSAMYPIIRFNMSGQAVLAAGEIAAAEADEWALHPGENVYNSLRFTAAQDFSADYELIFTTRDLNNDLKNKSSPGEAFYVLTNGVTAAEYLMPRGASAKCVLPLTGIKSGDTIDFIMRSQYNGGKNISCDMTSLAIELRKYYKRGLCVILRGINK